MAPLQNPKAPRALGAAGGEQFEELPEPLGVPESLEPEECGAEELFAEELDESGSELLGTLDPLEPDEVADEEDGKLELDTGALELLEPMALDDGAADELDVCKCELLGPSKLLEPDEWADDEGEPEEPLELDDELLLEEESKALDDDGSTPELETIALELLESGALDDGSPDELDELVTGGLLLDEELLSSPELEDELLGALLLDELLLDDEDDELNELLLELLGNDDEELLDDELELDELDELLDEELLLELLELDEDDELLGALLLDDKLLELLLGALLLDDDDISLDDGSPLDELSPEGEEPLELEELDELLLRLDEELLDEGHGGHSSGSSQQQPMKAFRSHAPRVVCPVRRLIVTV